ncbi:autoinducer binding domain-containing protein [Frigidibacter sp. RF13]|uniref:helix-turn-helix transcriptional regulator n=1 Tax=Frigidibacter sp. RF13 TaxID=2997340 RepID=UPI00227074C7|nr:autoinducer binding domain-containing protein [Frigidibacter sp. RF13]MCY1127971.1 autoinducer binding domain-containing protein [Frigidibacter sp. RF13]
MTKEFIRAERVEGGAQGTEFASLAPGGYYIALRIGFAFPLAEHNALPTAWIDRYTQQSYMVFDPVMQWVYRNAGAARWSEIAVTDPRGVLADAAQHGLRFGVAISLDDPGPKGQRSFGSFARGDREFDDAEIAALAQKLEWLHVAMAPPTNLTQAELEALSLVKQGYLVKEIANMLGVSEGAVKQRLKNAKTKLGAKTGSQAVSAATGYGLI